MRATILLTIALLACGEKDTVDSALDGDGDGYSVADGDCDDADASVSPEGVEVCDGLDNDCDGEVDVGASDGETFFTDGDGDGYGLSSEPVVACELPDGAAELDGDCDDQNNTISPGADEVCNGLDDDCDGEVDLGATDGSTRYLDSDGDGYGDPEVEVTACEHEDGYVELGGDCDDAAPEVNPDAEEVCNGLDDDCDGDADGADATDASTWYLDGDGDGFGDSSAPAVACEAPSGHVDVDGDCDDSAPTANPDAEEDCDDLDNDCDGVIDWGNRVPTDHADIQTALDSVGANETICVEAGTYTELLTFPSRAVTLQGTEGSDATIIDGDGDGPVVSIDSSAGASSTLVGLTVSGGDALLGAGVYLQGSSPTLVDVVIRDNSCEGSRENCRGTGLYVNGGDPILQDVVVRDNLAEGYNVYGAGAYFNASVAYVSGLHIEANVALADNVVYGSGLSLRNASSLDVDNLAVIGNLAEAGLVVAGGGVYLHGGSEPVVDGAIVAGNEVVAPTTYGAGVMVNGDMAAVFTNAVVHGNDSTATTETYGTGLTTYGSTILVNSVISANTESGTGDDTRATGLYNGTASTPAVLSYCDVYGNDVDDFYNIDDPTGSDGNLSVDPGFTDVSGADPALWDFTLAASSDLIDAGDPSLSDPDGSVSDIGAYGGPTGADW